MAEQKTKPAVRRKRSRPAAATPTSVAVTEPEPQVPRGRTAALDPKEEQELLHRGVALFNGLRYWHAHEAWETAWKQAKGTGDEELFKGLSQMGAGYVHLLRGNAHGAITLLRRGASRIGAYPVGARGIDTVTLAGRLEADAAAVEDGSLLPGPQATTGPLAV